MEDSWKIVLYAVGIALYGLYKFVLDKKKTGDKASPAENTAAKPFMSPAASPEAAVRPVAGQQPTNQPSTSLEDWVRRLTNDQTAAPVPAPMLEDKVRQQHRKPVANPVAESRSLENAVPDNRSLEGAGYEQQMPQYRNEANEVNYEIPERAAYRGLNDASKSWFKEFEQHPPTVNPYAELLQNPKNIRNAFVLSEIFKRKEW